MPLKYDSACSMCNTHLSLCSFDQSNVGERCQNMNTETVNKLHISSLKIEKQIQNINTDLENTFQSPEIMSSLLGKYSVNSPNVKTNSLSNANAHLLNRGIEFDNLKQVSDKDGLRIHICNQKIENTNTQTVLLFPQKYQILNNPVIRKSKKSTNLVKYKNICEEPPLERQLNTFKILGKCKGSCETDNINVIKTSIKNMNTTQADVVKTVHVGLQHTLPASEYDSVAEKLMITIFQNFKSYNESNRNVNIKDYLNQIVKELYDIKLERSDVHPVKNLFRCLLEYWLNNTTHSNFNQINKITKSIERQSNKYFMKDETTSNYIVRSVAKSIQFHGIDDLIKEKVNGCDEVSFEYNGKKYKLPTKSINNSFDKEKRLSTKRRQDLERILKNTVCVCKTVSSGDSRDIDIKITKKMIDSLDLNLQKIIDRPNEQPYFENSSSSIEFPKIQETMNHLISETSIPPDFAKEFLAAYLDLLHDSENNHDSPSSSEEKFNVCEPKCDVQAESIQKKVSINLSTTKKSKENDKQNREQLLDPGQLYLKNVLDKITIHSSDERVSSISTTVKEKPLKAKPISLNLSFVDKDFDISDSNKMFHPKLITPYLKIQNTIDIDDNANCNINLNPYISSVDSCHKDIQINKLELKHSWSDGTSNAHRPPDLSSNYTKLYHAFYDDENFNQTGLNETQFGAIGNINTTLADDCKSCYIMSLKGTVLTSKLMHSKNDIKMNGNAVNADEQEPSCSSSVRDHQEELSIFENIPKLIDEKFILQLLENVCTLSKNLPTLHKDINSLYLKLRKKHEKLLIICNKTRGLGLLGKIYQKDIEETGTQCDYNMCPKQKSVNNATNTSNYDFKKSAVDVAIGESNIHLNKQANFDGSIDVKENNINTIKLMSKNEAVGYNTQTESLQ
ncbi:uncharacterized protein LOC128198674 [Bicyclus anynana]|uniref:Uncharacterized protein LOC128198674 n=1 Tax=Bicyclus anynana TaxID=110368 RepID=A0ABM3LPS1_BICAN|nr:uncharacterized protein LOC128198674 [Bicyclus anynana]